MTALLDLRRRKIPKSSLVRSLGILIHLSLSASCEQERDTRFSEQSVLI